VYGMERDHDHHYTTSQPKDLDLNIHRRENLKSYTYKVIYKNIFYMNTIADMATVRNEILRLCLTNVMQSKSVLVGIMHGNISMKIIIICSC
jgi:hypothetical protein